LGDGKWHWKNVEARTSGFVVEGDAKYLRSIKTASGRMYVVANNNSLLDCFFVLRN
jgi:hypothetical protein